MKIYIYVNMYFKYFFKIYITVNWRMARRGGTDNRNYNYVFLNYNYKLYISKADNYFDMFNDHYY